MDELRFSARVTSRPDGQADVRVRKRSFEVGAPLTFDNAYDGITAVEQLLGSLGADLVNGLLNRAKKRRVEIDSAEATVEGELDNALMYLDVVGEKGTTAIKRISVRLYVSTFATAGAVKAVWAETLQRSPLANTLKRAVKLDISMKIAI